MNRPAVTEDDLRVEHGLHPRLSRIPLRECLADRAIRICLTQLAEARRRRAGARPQFELLPT